ncbi:enoyl-CoA hydratase-related protein [Sphingobium sp. MK2]|uniref:enoyl-CoA hydratase-related protein n=1 Tax=Sphingobium sp. MK2 TaxID=3116540 RepID=UPI0032E364A6
MKFETLEMTIENRIATILLSRAPVNAQNRQMRLDLIAALDRINENDEIQAVILAGAGKCFSAGADLKERPQILASPGGYSEHNRIVREACDAVLECRKPVIAAVHGAAIGAGCVLPLVCDILIVSDDAFFAMTEVDYGMAGGVRHVMRALGQSNARMMIFTARRFSGADMYRMNVASVCVPRERLMAEAQQIATEIAGKHYEAILAAKRSFDFTEEMPLRNGYRYEQTQTAALARLRETQENFANFGKSDK